ASQRIDGFVLTPQGFVRGFLTHQQGRISAIEGTPMAERELLQDTGDLPMLLPGFIDLHVHGGGGHDTMEGGEAAMQ
ncbi:N-acetylglucosamine-6-phosphate deacetylase, partial [Roseateles sp. GG27B]